LGLPGVVKLDAKRTVTMAPSADRSDLRPRELAELSALADGSLDPARRAQVEADIHASAELSALYERERQIVELLHEARATERAPQRLRARIEAARPSRPVRARRRTTYIGGLAGALAAVVLALVLVLPSGTPGAPSVSQAAALAALAPAAPAPVPDPSQPTVKLGQNVGDVYFPNWTGRFGWRAVGQRSDRINGRPATTVYYDWHGKRLAYTIVGAPALRTPSARVTQLHGTVLRTLMLHGRLVVTWRRSGHTCVLSGRGVPAAVLQQLASWRAPDSGA
jgi:anti-sigma factor RsiW